MLSSIMYRRNYRSWTTWSKTWKRKSSKNRGKEIDNTDSWNVVRSSNIFFTVYLDCCVWDVTKWKKKTQWLIETISVYNYFSFNIHAIEFTWTTFQQRRSEKKNVLSWILLTMYISKFSKINSRLKSDHNSFFS